MASKANALEVKGGALLVPDSKVLPTSFLDALKQGWTVAYEKTTLSIDGRRREGMLILKRPGFPKLEVPYIASAKKGYTFGEPLLM